MIALITGGRDYRDRRELETILDRLNAEHRFTILVHADAAGTKRNQRMFAFAQPDLLIAFPGGRGTANMIRIGFEAHKRGHKVQIIDVEDQTSAKKV